MNALAGSYGQWGRRLYFVFVVWYTILAVGGLCTCLGRFNQESPCRAIHGGQKSLLSIALTSGKYCLLLQWFVPESVSGSVTWVKLPAALSQHQSGIVVKYRVSSVMPWLDSPVLECSKGASLWLNHQSVIFCRPCCCSSIFIGMIPARSSQL